MAYLVVRNRCGKRLARQSRGSLLRLQPVPRKVRSVRLVGEAFGSGEVVRREPSPTPGVSERKQASFGMYPDLIHQKRPSLT